MKIPLILIIAVVIFLSACAPVYKPPLINPALFDEPAQVQALIGYGTGGGNLALSVSATQNLFLGAGGYFFTQTNSFNSSIPGSDRDQNIYGEFYVGYYTTFGSTGRFNIAGGVGTGSGRVTTDDLWSSTVYQRGKFIRPFIQPNIGLGSEYIDLGFAPRFAYIHFTEFISDPQYSGSLSSMFIEPIVYVNLGVRNIKFNIQGGLSIPAQIDNFVAFDYNPIIFGIGASFNINRYYLD